MAADSLFASVNFRHAIQECCKRIGWQIADLNENRALLRFETGMGRTQNLFILRYDSTLEFSAPSTIQFETEDQIPNHLLIMLLRRNTESKIGFWCIETLDGKLTSSYMHNADLSRIVDVEYFADVAQFLVRECEEVEEMANKMIRTGRLASPAIESLKQPASKYE